MIGANTTITTYRLADSGVKSEYSGTATLTGIDAYIESIRSELQSVLNVQPGYEVFTCHIDPADVKVGDKVIDAASVEYRVHGIERHEGNDDVEDLYILTLYRAATFHA